MVDTALDLNAIEARYRAAAGRPPWWEERDQRAVRAKVWTEDIPALMVEVKQLRQDHHDERVKRGEWEKKAYDLTSTEIEELRAELALTRVELNRVRQDAQDQSDEVQELWLSPCEAEGLRRQLAQAVVAQADARLAQHVLELKAGLERQSAYTERALRQEAEQCAEHAESLAALVTLELARLLDQMATLLYTSGWRGYAKGEIETAGRIAVHIREALGETE